MMQRLLISLLMLPVLAFAQTPVILVFGDSLSAGYGLAREDGWVWRLDARLRQLGLPYQVVNASVSGETTAGGLARLPSLLRAHQPAILIIELGANDGLRGLQHTVIRDNLTALIQQGRGSRILLLGVPLPPNYGAAYLSAFQDVFKSVSQTEGVTLVPNLLQDVAEHWELMQPDGIHPTAEAQARILDTVWTYLEPLLQATSRTDTP